jgi:beta-glucosidase
VNYYTRNVARSEKISEEENLPVEVVKNDEYTEMSWEVYPYGLYKTLGRVYFDYGFRSIYITENGAAFPDEVNADGSVDDPARLSYLKRHLEMVHKAIEAEIPVNGYFYWSLLDNFEWGFGYRPRFGIVRVDYDTLKRTLKHSALFYKDVIKENGL